MSSEFNVQRSESRKAARALWLRALLAAALAFASGCESEKKAEQEKARAAAAEETIEKTDDKGPVKITARVTPKRPRLSDIITYELILSSDPEIDVKKPTFGKGVREFTIRDYVALPEKLEDGKRVRRFRYKLEAEQAGTLLIRSQRVEYADNRAPSKEFSKRLFVASPPIEVTVTSTLGDTEPDLKNLSEMSEPVALGGPEWVRWVLGAAVGGLVGGLLAWLALRGGKSKPAAQRIRTPEEIARAELDALLAERLAERGEFKEFYVRLTGIVRRYIERKTGIHAPEQTTEEFLRDPATKKIFSPKRAERLGQFLEAADMVKYAAQLPGGRELDESVERAREFIGMSSALAPMPQLGVPAAPLPLPALSEGTKKTNG